MLDVQQMLWAPVNFIIGVARGGARRMVQGAAAPTAELEDEEAMAKAQPLRSSPSQHHQNQLRSHRPQGGGHSHADELSDQLVHKAAINIPVKVEEDAEAAHEQKQSGVPLEPAGRTGVAEGHQA